MNIEDKKIFNYCQEVVKKYKDRKRNESEEMHYQSALNKIKELSEYSETEEAKKMKKFFNN